MAEQQRRRREDKFLARVYKFFRRIFTFVGFMVTLMMVMVVLAALESGEHEIKPLPDKILLTYTFDDSVVEVADAASLSDLLLDEPVTLSDITGALDAAAKDDRVKGFVARIADADMSPAQVQELRDAIMRFRASGKFAYAYATNYGGGMAGMRGYYLASAFEKIWMQPVGSVAINGVSAQVPFFKGFFEKIGVQADFVHKGKYKSAPESLTETAMTAPSREMMEGMVADLFDQMATGIASARGLTVADVRQMVDNSPYTDKQAVEAKLIDKLGYGDEFMQEAKSKVDGDATEPVSLADYRSSSKNKMGKLVAGFSHKKETADKSAQILKPAAAKKIAVVYAAGEITEGRSSKASELEDSGMTASKYVPIFRKIQKNDDIAAVVLRIDSPGGDPSAAESIRRALTETRRLGKPVIVSMGGYAASGGYWIACAADKIVAQPGTLTGSIGVFGGKFVVGGVMQKLGIGLETVSVGQNADMWSSAQNFTPEQRAKFENMMGGIYDAFIDRVAEGRHMPREDVMAVAEGHVWTGREAQDRKLVDEIGGLDRAIALAKQAGGLDPSQEADVVEYPPRQSTIERVISLATEGNTQLFPALTELRQMMSLLQWREGVMIR